MARNYELQNLFEEKLKMIGTTLNEFCRVNGITKNTYYSAFENETRVRKKTLIKISILLQFNNAEIFNLLLFHGYVLSVSPLDKALVEFLATTPVNARTVMDVDNIFNRSYPSETSIELKNLLNEIRHAIDNPLREGKETCFTQNEMCYDAGLGKKAFYNALSSNATSPDTILRLSFSYYLNDDIINYFLLFKGYTWREGCYEDDKIRRYMEVTPITKRHYDDLLEFEYFAS